MPDDADDLVPGTRRLNEHFSGVNAGTMFGDGIYLAEDMGKSDQYCACAKRPLLGAGMDPALKKVEGELWHKRKPPKDVGELRYVFVCRSILGVFLQAWWEQPLVVV